MICDTVKTALSYTEIHLMSFPEFTYTYDYLGKIYTKLLEQTKEANEKLSVAREKKKRGGK